ncbi:GIY-YIG nuclease family protein [Bacillus tuaregi]|uniref:GIY-YIG nuclease family protein n=1 Tax=Bacillus tuaregi TaxID=1816695 RepID=UPI000AEFE583|nr:GIY-YIG nuclease family protein [Bacillus tuaregi]
MNPLNDKVKKLPSTAGVYLMKDAQGGIIYVGKSKNLKSRVQSYFYHSKAHSRKIERLVKTVKDIEIIETDTEFEAFMLECQLIKEIKPYFNKLMKNPLSYTYIVINMDEKIHRVEISHSISQNKKQLYFGPFTSKSTVEKAIEGFKDCYKINCSNPNQSSPCLNYTLGLCIGMCQDGAALNQFHSIIDKLISLLNGTDRILLEEMEDKMNAAANNFEFETAAKYRNVMKYLNTLVHKERMIEFTEEDHSIVTMESIGEGCYKLFLIKRNQILYSRMYSVNKEQEDHLWTDLSKDLIEYFQTPYPSAKLSRDEVDSAQIIYNYLKNNNHYAIISEALHQSEDAIKDQLRQLFSIISQDEY